MEVVVWGFGVCEGEKGTCGGGRVIESGCADSGCGCLGKGEGLVRMDTKRFDVAVLIEEQIEA
jgi:hypothetical protein